MRKIKGWQGRRRRVGLLVIVTGSAVVMIQCIVVFEDMITTSRGPYNRIWIVWSRLPIFSKMKLATQQSTYHRTS